MASRPPDDLPCATALGRPDRSILGIGYALLIDSGQTAGAYEVMQFVVPAGHGPPPHIHRREDESFYVVSGEFEVTVGEDQFCARAGDCLHLPRDQPHGFRNAADELSTFLCWVMPGNLAGFFDAFARPWPAEQEQPPAVVPEDIDKMLAAAPRFQIEIVSGPDS